MGCIDWLAGDSDLNRRKSDWCRVYAALIMGPSGDGASRCDAGFAAGADCADSDIGFAIQFKRTLVSLTALQVNCGTVGDVGGGR
jgi:hypothetical protein